MLYVVTLRQLGTARTGAYYAAAPFIGVGLAIILLGEPVTPPLVAAALLMAAGLVLHLTEDHGHDHPQLEHSHAHRHDDHHAHQHSSDLPDAAEHTHPHAHSPLLHRHPHYPDFHHRHAHETAVVPHDSRPPERLE